ncbi:hypothetical protein Pmar_PMAR019916 [Perkinsus marinus ATCC 50983]|uniref:Uncharacterized protein n=1 Tax=Perkinsus marinus (strain ATCC 50983 / TXsc) TaxID=423536 RepID=C5KC02_PERM5|nr:hypothetical protein Pmar_PMAR019916 [Perkinsus marinus ATCC 50983]EER18033.1 hypothetical protein Pmar_PMAR019916 [Perkinsus marinus ATCC 50983]|eukprot:XP_002786237.1 hypothetical protein Pmar_PMAR019916 [Perkinsus marinus ATCC 50983]
MDDLVNLVAVNWKRAWNRAGVPIINEEDASRLLKTYIKEAVVEAQEYVKRKHTAADSFSETLEKAISQLSTM